MKSSQARMAARPCQQLHEFYGRLEIALELSGRSVDLQPRAQGRPLGGDPDRAVVRMTGPHAKAPDGLQRGVGEGDAIRTQG